MRALMTFWLTALLAFFAQAQFTYDPVSAEIVEARLRDVPHKNQVRHRKLEELFNSVNCDGEQMQNQVIKYSNSPNLICTLPGETDSVIIVGAHFDNQGSGAGVVDNWSGASLLPSIYQSLAKNKRKHTFRFIGFTDEEVGLVGSRYYVDRLSKEEVPLIKAMVNIDTVGLGPASVWLSSADKLLANAFLVIVNALNMPAIGMNIDGVGSTDSESFRVRKIPSITIHSVTRAKMAILHTGRDRINEVNLEEHYKTYRLVLAYLTFLDGQLP
jgi:peptidase M28-like protein